ncbi:precorrin-6A reductase [Clostridiaceae bacterium 35-E11]
MILILSGTQDGRELIDSLTSRNYPVIATTATSYGANLIESEKVCKIIAQKLNKEEMEGFILSNEIKIVIDATHPYAVEASQNAMKACENTKIPYFRFQREESKIQKYQALLQTVASYDEAVEVLKNIEGNILLTTGSKTLEIFAQQLDPKKIFPRILPISEMIKKCEEWGIKPSNIIAMQGPFSVKMNVEIIKKYQISILVSKESGDIGGTLDKLEAAHKMEIPVLLIQRPVIQYRNLYSDMDALIRKVSEIYG